jgi:hypothetical protein
MPRWNVGLDVSLRLPSAARASRVSQPDLLASIADRLEAAGIPYMVVGSVAGSFHGEPRTTIDIDIVIDPTAESLRRFVESLQGREFYVSDAAAEEALARRTSFNVIDTEAGGKVDLVVRRAREFSRVEFERRLTVPMLGRMTPIATAEDTILAKLEWAKSGESERQLRDAAGIVAVVGDGLDMSYIDHWIVELGLEDVWRRCKRLAEADVDS